MDDKKTKPFVRACAMCRGEGLGYVALRSVCEVEGVQAIASLRDDTPVPCMIFPVTSESQREVLAPNASMVWVAVVPLLAVDCELFITAKGKGVCTVAFPALRSKVSSRWLSTAKPKAAAILRGFERRQGYGKAMVHIREVWPAKEGAVVWRVSAVFPQVTKDADAHLSVYDDKGKSVETATVVLEDQVVQSDRDQSQLVRLVTFSCELPKSMRSFFVIARAGDKRDALGFDSMNAPRAAGMLASTNALANGSANNAVYERWFDSHCVTGAELQQQKSAFAKMEVAKPLLSLVTCVCQGQGNGLVHTVASVIAQSYANWELVVVGVSDACEKARHELTSCVDDRVHVITVADDANAADVGIDATRGDYVGLVGCGDKLEPDALWCFVRKANDAPNADLLYCDEDSTDGSQEPSPVFKTFANYGKLYEYNYLGHLMLVSRWALEHASVPCKDAAAAYDYELALRVMEVARDIQQIPRVLYHGVRAGELMENATREPLVHEAGRRALQAHLERRGIAAYVEDGLVPKSYRVCFELTDPQPAVSIVIPTRDQADLLRSCVQSILTKTTYKNYEIILVENNSVEEQTFALYDELQALDERVSVVSWEPPEPGIFNYAAIVNHGVAQATGEAIVLLNNDTEVIEPRWLDEMVGCLMRPEVGVVGAKLLFGDGLIQHVGMVANSEGGFGHVCQNLTSDALGPSYAAAMPGDYSMVTGACQLIRRSLFEELGGYDENLAVGFNDGDFCLRVREAGYAVTVCAHAMLHHREFATRGRESTDARLRKRHMLERAYVISKHSDFFAQGDPAINPNLDSFGGYFTLRNCDD